MAGFGFKLKIFPYLENHLVIQSLGLTKHQPPLDTKC